jgi:tetratricopeptide (TPR) repeat protein
MMQYKGSMMKLYFNELAPWERKNEYYRIIQLGKTAQAQTEAINGQTKKMTAAQLASTNSIIASQERISEGIDILSYGIDKVEKGIHGLQASFEWGISEVVWQIEQNREILRDILQVLSKPLDTEAKELRSRANEAYANGWMDDALEDFLESEKKNKYDFSIHISLGLIYLFHKLDKKKSLDYFEKAIKYARPKSAYYTSYALLYKALIMRDFGKIEEAKNCTLEAIELTPDFSEAYYQSAQYNSLLNNPEQAIAMLEIAINNDVNYCEKSCSDIDFNNIRSYLFDLFEKIRKREEIKAKNLFSEVNGKYNKLAELIISNKEIFDIPLEEKLSNSLKRIESLIRRHSYRDYLEANNILSDCSKSINDLLAKVKNRIKNRISTLNSMKNEKESSQRKKIKNIIENLGVIWLIAIPLGIILGARGCLIESNKIIHPFTDSYGPSFKAFFHISFITILITAAVHLCLYVFLKLYELRQPNLSREIDCKIQQANEILRGAENI